MAMMCDRCYYFSLSPTRILKSYENSKGSFVKFGVTVNYMVDYLKPRFLSVTRHI